MKPLSILLQSAIIFIFCNSSALAAAEAEFSAGKKYMAVKQYKSALSFFDRCVDSDPTNADYHFWRGKSLSYLARASEAASEFKLAALLSSDSKIKEACRLELARYKQPLPRGSVNSAANTEKSQFNKESRDKYFKLSSKKLDWNLQMRQDYLQSMKAKTDKLALLARGDRWRVPAAADNSALRVGAIEGPDHSRIPLSAGERQALQAADIMIILDHSGSMSQGDCPEGNGFTSRLGWCAEELSRFSDLILAALPHGFHLISFDSQPQVFNIRSAAQLREVLQEMKAGSGTNLSSALNEAFRVHMAHSNQALLLAVLTDAEVDFQEARNTLAEASKRFPLPNGVFVSILQVGALAEIHTADRIHDLDKLDRDHGAKYDLCRGILFSQLRKDGLGRDLLSSMRSNQFNVLNAESSGKTDHKEQSSSSADKDLKPQLRVN
ncbi:MAG: VWA domain-containing protein [Candidatus Obscuribacterales bacterium]|nr:VWA domain-containing protein [Candidatus Obscuribacterales bacterium]